MLVVVVSAPDPFHTCASNTEKWERKKGNKGSGKTSRPSLSKAQKVGVVTKEYNY